MFGIFYLAWFALALVLFIFIVRNLIRWFREPELRRRTLARTAAQLIVLASLTWPFLLGRAVYELKCHYQSGLNVESTIDLRDGGYLIWPDAFDKMLTASPQWESLAYDHQGVQDLLMGRIVFFERPVFQRLGGTSSYRINYERFRLGNSRDRGCVGAEREATLLMGLQLPEGICITRSESRDSLTQYRLEGELLGREHYPAHIGRTDFRREFVNHDSGATVASYKMFSHWSGLIADAGELVYQCPAPNETFNHSPLRGLTAFVLRDKKGDTVSFESLRKWKDATKPDSGLSFGELPPRALTGQLDAKSSSACRAEPLEGDYAVYRIQTYGGRNAISTRLDGSENTVGQLEVVVNDPDQPVVLWLSAYDPVVWHISRTADSRIAAVLVKGTHGQAVLGLQRSVPLYVSTSIHSPGSNCDPAEMNMAHRLILRDTIPVRDVNVQASPSLSQRFVLVGTEVPDRSELLYSRDRTLKEFTLDVPPAKLPRSARRESLLYSPDPLE